MPLFVKPNAKVSLMDTMQFMRSHYENTPLDMSGQEFSDVGAYTYSIYRTHPLTWSSTVQPDGATGSQPLSYFNERPIATPQTGWNFVAQSRKWMPKEISGLIWFGVDDSGTTVRFPVYGSATKVSPAFLGKGPQDGVTPPMMDFNLQSAFYVFNLLANWAYARWDLIYPEVLQTIVAKESEFIGQIQQVDKKALEILEEKRGSPDGMAQAVDYVTNYSVNAGNKLVNDWFQYFGKLFVKYREGYVITANTENHACGCAPKAAGYPQSWYDRIVKDTGSHYLSMDDASVQSKNPKLAKKYGAVQPADKIRIVSK
jgi:dipeptidase